MEFIETHVRIFLALYRVLDIDNCRMRFILLLVNRILRHRNIRKHGWPPNHIDGDGDFKQKEK